MQSQSRDDIPQNVIDKMSVIGLTKCPLHVILADTENGIKRATISMMLNRVFAP
ncbi:hypothetical protein RiCNE_13540 [Rickettsia endosymbiont of Culicoides newsteadi]|nr:hypothetical protein RiCNE_13540 [Rickettsia endosymbiont of Culicoides newsteadi]